MLKKITDYFIPQNTDKSTEYQRRLRLVTYTIFATAIFSLFYVFTSYTIGFAKGVYIMLAAFFIDLLLLFLLKLNFNVFHVANYYGLFGALSIYGCIFFSGGFSSPVLPWLASTPIVLLLIAGKKSGIFWAVISVVMVLTFGLLDISGYNFPKEYDPAKESLFFISCHGGLVLIIFLISTVFENVRISAFTQIIKQKDELQSTLSELKSAQTQLVHAEKMASLGELTAGIAHEIQNPLNFINNFSDLNKEMIIELKEEVKSGNYEDANAIADDIQANEEKINHHGKRADAIVKGMLQHSRSNAGQKELTDINKLANEYLRLSYHGLRAKDKSFNAEFITDFDDQTGKVNVIPQDISRVILNLVNNAFYAVNEKKKLNIPSYKPTVAIITKKKIHVMEFTVKDNGNGIPHNLKEKIFQPFFTTKPSGEGTGLGLGLCFDIIKAHGGELTVKSVEGQSTEFTFSLPL